ncbi:4447_t:CDS:2, partial [Racocetra fulgida]
HVAIDAVSLGIWHMPLHSTLCEIAIRAKSQKRFFLKYILAVKNWQNRFMSVGSEKTDKMDSEYGVITEGKASILFPKNNKVFYNNVQQFNRDLSIAAIKIWSEIFSEEKQKKAQQKKDSDIKTQSYTFTILEALAASGLRSIRYAKELSNIKYIVANDLDLDAVNLINRNVEYNELSKDFVRANQGDA